MKPIYKPKGRAAEYGDYALNIYTECNHGCTYCYARDMAKRFGKPWVGNIKPRDGIVETTKRQLEKEKMTGKLIFLCFTCDPYPAEIDTTATREVIDAIKDSGNNVKILTKGGKRAERDFDLLGDGDWFGVTLSGYRATSDIQEPNAAIVGSRLDSIKRAYEKGIKTWVSCEPVFDTCAIQNFIVNADYVDLFKIGKLNYAKSNINWGEFGREVERLCKLYGRNYLIKEDLRKEMEERG
jgi:DNA repair photolyase